MAVFEPLSLQDRIRLKTSFFDALDEAKDKCAQEIGYCELRKGQGEEVDDFVNEIKEVFKMIINLQKFLDSKAGH